MITTTIFSTSTWTEVTAVSRSPSVNAYRGIDVFAPEFTTSFLIIATIVDEGAEISFWQMLIGITTLELTSAVPVTMQVFESTDDPAGPKLTGSSAPSTSLSSSMLPSSSAPTSISASTSNLSVLRTPTSDGPSITPGAYTSSPTSTSALTDFSEQPKSVPTLLTSADAPSGLHLSDPTKIGLSVSISAIAILLLMATAVWLRRKSRLQWHRCREKRKLTGRSPRRDALSSAGARRDALSDCKMEVEGEGRHKMSVEPEDASHRIQWDRPGSARPSIPKIHELEGTEKKERIELDGKDCKTADARGAETSDVLEFWQATSSVIAAGSRRVR